jgi:2-polyprenyl-3-methyl-5-hydroxy-6-metoxy-1,4-benzoquinol methylase
MDKAGVEYWNNVWQRNNTIAKFDYKYYTNSLIHNLFQKYLNYDKNKSICEIGCAFSAFLPYFKDNFGFDINGFDYDNDAVLMTRKIYKEMGYEANIFYKDFFEKEVKTKYDILFSWGVFEHFENLDNSILHTKNYLKDEGIIITVIPNMNGIVGFLQKTLNKKVYDIHIPYKKKDILKAHENAGYKTLFCDYFGIYQGGVVNIVDIKFESLIGKVLSIPGKPLFYLNHFLHINLNSELISPYIIYIGKK